MTFDEIKARIARARSTGINVYTHADVKWLLDRVESLEAGVTQTNLLRGLPLPIDLQAALLSLWQWTQSHGDTVDPVEQGLRAARKRVEIIIGPWIQQNGAPQHDAYTIQLSKREMDVAREWIAYAVTIPSDHPDADKDNETAESVIAKLEALGAKGTL